MMAGSKCRHLNKGGLGLHTKASYQGRASPRQSPLRLATLPRKRLHNTLDTTWKTNPGFPLFPPPLGNLANPARFPHSHSSGGPRLEKWKTKIRFPTFPHATRDDDDDSFQNIKIKTKPRRLRRPKNKPKKESFTPQNDISVRPTSRLTSHWKRNPLSGSFRVGNKYRFQAHFRIGKCSTPLFVTAWMQPHD